MHNERELRFYDALGIKRPEHIPHGVNPDTIQDSLRKLIPHTWKLTGNQLRGMTDMGELVQTIPTDYILTGTKDGLPILEKIKITVETSSPPPLDSPAQGDPSQTPQTAPPQME